MAEKPEQTSADAARTRKGAAAREREEALDESLMMTFPASDPPAWMGERAAVMNPTRPQGEGTPPDAAEQ